MEFTEDKAAEIIEKFGLAKSTLNVWRLREAIPDKYAAGKLPEKISTESELQQAENLLRAINTGKFDLASLCRLAELKNYYVVQDAARGKAVLNREDLLGLKNAINFIRIDLKKVLSGLESRSVSQNTVELFKKAFERPELKWFIIFDRNRPFWGKIEGWDGGRRSFPEEEKDRLKGYILVFLAETSI